MTEKPEWDSRLLGAHWFGPWQSALPWTKAVSTKRTAVPLRLFSNFPSIDYHYMIYLALLNFLLFYSKIKEDVH